MLSGLDALALTKLDVLDEFEEIKLCTSYKSRDGIIEDIPYGANALAECEPVYETVPGWKTKTSGITKFDELPEAAKSYVRLVERLCNAPVALISTGPERTETIIREESLVSEWMK
jgi:adenylosuccinate synthase